MTYREAQAAAEAVVRDRLAQLEADLAAVWERKRELDVVEVQLRARVAELSRALAEAIDDHTWPERRERHRQLLNRVTR